MTFKNHHYGKPEDRTPEIKAEINFFNTISPFLTKKQQGNVMGAFRAALAEIAEAKNNG